MIFGLVASGVTTFPLAWELKLLARFLAYGTDWLAFAHLCIAAALIGAWRDPAKNRGTIDWALLCRVGVFPLALICGPLRQIPFLHRPIDCAFGFFGAIPLLLVRRHIDALERGAVQ